MSKAILVMDMPESCSKCKFLYEFGGIKKCELMNVLYAGVSKLSQNNFTKSRHEKCPLKPLPEKKEEYYENKVKDINGRWITMSEGTDSVAIGYNACIDELLKGAANEQKRDNGISQ